MRKCFVLFAIPCLLLIGISIVLSHNFEPTESYQLIGGESPMYSMFDYDVHTPMWADGTIYTYFTGKMRWYAYGYVYCGDDRYKSTYWIDTHISRLGEIVDEDNSPRARPNDYTKFGKFSDMRTSSHSEILPIGVSRDPRHHINDCYSFTVVRGAPLEILGEETKVVNLVLVLLPQQCYQNFGSQQSRVITAHTGIHLG